LAVLLLRKGEGGSREGAGAFVAAWRDSEASACCVFCGEGGRATN